ncbi:patatin-like phospholipase family protein [Clostridium sediminicola]|uniref:patatin-like phospholipase family protein n=1 Tax=Clostridium sediminicola TaxID=3114879 RepID=UPI0031F1ECF0
MYGLVLEGGGAKGAYHIGAYKALMEKNIEISAITGTSIGALNGAMLVQGDFQKAYDLWYNISNSQIFDVDDEILDELKKYQLNQTNISYLLRQSLKIMNNKGIDTKTIRKIINDNINEDKLRNSKIDFGIVTVSLSDMKPMEIFVEDIPKEKVKDYLMASANFPAFKLEKLDGKVFIDGGLYDNFPIRLMLSKGYDKIIAIRTYGIGVERKINTKKLDITYINPSEDLGNTLDFNKETSRKNLKLGYYDALKVLDGLKGNKYYIDNSNNPDFFTELLWKLSKENCNMIGEIFGYKGIPHRRMLFELIIPRVVDLLDLDKERDYEDICIELCEIIALELEMERFKIYELGDFLEELYTKFQSNNKEYKSSIPKFIKTNSILSKVVKDEVLKEIVIVLLQNIA